MLDVRKKSVKFRDEGKNSRNMLHALMMMKRSTHQKRAEKKNYKTTNRTLARKKISADNNIHKDVKHAATAVVKAGNKQ